jgi:ferredoxin--NADP+ reductase
MNKIIERKAIVPNIHLLKIEASQIAAKIRPGQFIVVMADQKGERIPLTVADWDNQCITTVFMEVGTSTAKLTRLKPGDTLPVVVGPLGKPLAIESFGTVVCAGGCYGIAVIFPVVRALREKENKVISVIEARSSFLLYWQERIREVSDELIIATQDGSAGRKGYASKVIAELVKNNRSIQRIFAFGCTLMMRECSEATQESGIPTIVGLNPIMLDGTGMCGACRILVDGKTRFACVDGPNFDGHKVDWNLLRARRGAYITQEIDSSHKHI